MEQDFYQQQQQKIVQQSSAEQLPAYMPPTRKTKWFFIILGSLFMLGIGGAGGYYFAQSQNVPEITKNIPTPQPVTPSTLPVSPTISSAVQENPETKNWKKITFHDITLKIPPTWYASEITTDEKNGAKRMYINPTQLPYPSDAVPGFALYSEPNLPVGQLQETVTKDWGLSNITEKEILVDTLSATSLEGTTQPGFLDAKRFNYVFFRLISTQYYFQNLDLVDNNKLYFQQMLSTIKVVYQEVGVGESCWGRTLRVCKTGLTCEQPPQTIASAPGICVKN